MKKEISIKLFGAFRKYDSGSGELRFSVPSDANVLCIKQRIVAEIEKIEQNPQIKTLVSDSVLANNGRILQESDGLTEDTQFSILPPVCGG